ncbi:class I SAM-dependent methyltransferase [Actinopolymorpha alba]|uniref:class I SAM-dependent methyltransferase n=1 Tax=Actinopolymorpha alba TaxID=533267 RepID=UPI000361967C|nr:class I SAM-dependent methyltransferase [Actinopolymorpha alba]
MRDLTVPFVTKLYDRYLDELQLVRKEQRELHEINANAGMKAQLDDLEAEITYLLLREYRPDTVVEIGSLHGWSTSWILRALRDNGSGELHTFDRINNATRYVPPDLSAGRWTFVHGDVRRNLPRIPATVDYLFIDAAHSARFARWYLAALLPTLPSGTPVSVHDVFHGRSPLPFTEGSVLLDWLGSRQIPYLTASPAKSPEVYRELMRVRTDLGLVEPIHRGKDNPMAFFNLA